MHITTYSPNYAGCKIIEIFDEARYLDALKDFLRRKNPTLLALLLAITTDSDQNVGDGRELKQSEHLLEMAVSNASLLDTQESLACLGHSIAEVNLRSKNSQYETREVFEARCKLTSVQRLAPDQGIVTQTGQVVPAANLCPQLMDKQFAIFETQYGNMVDEAIKAQFNLLSHVEQSKTLEKDAFEVLREHEWERLAIKDKAQLVELKEYLEHAEETMQILIDQKAKECFTYSIAVSLAPDKNARRQLLQGLLGIFA